MTGLLVCFDQATKMYIHTQLTLGQEIVVWDNFFNITYVRNYGAAFGILRDLQEDYRNLFFLLMPPIALVIIIFILKGVPERDKATVFALSSVFGGAVGNYIDRVRFRYVIDFLDFYVPKDTVPFSMIGLSDWPATRAYHWPAFNIADIGIVCGVCLLIMIEIKRMWEAKPENSDAPEEAAST